MLPQLNPFPRQKSSPEKRVNENQRGGAGFGTMPPGEEPGGQPKPSGSADPLGTGSQALAWACRPGASQDH